MLSKISSTLKTPLGFEVYSCESDLLKEVESREALDFESLSECLVLGGVDLGYSVGWVLSLEHLSGSLVLGGKFLAVSARHRRKDKVSLVKRTRSIGRG